MPTLIYNSFHAACFIETIPTASYIPFRNSQRQPSCTERSLSPPPTILKLTIVQFSNHTAFPVSLMEETRERNAQHTAEP